MSRKAFDTVTSGVMVRCTKTATDFIKELHFEQQFPIIGNEYVVSQKATKENAMGNCILLHGLKCTLPLPFEWFEVIN